MVSTMVKRGPQLVQLIKGYRNRLSPGSSSSLRQSLQRAISGGIEVLAVKPATLGRIENRPLISLAKVGRDLVSIEVMHASGGACSCIACRNNCNLSSSASAVITTPSLVLVTVPAISKREARL